jgi:hypothetical protein
MGLDEDRLIAGIEDEFGITIAADEVRCARTVKDLHTLVLRKLEPKPACLDGMVFHRTRKALAQTLAIPPRSIAPMTRVEPLMPLETRIEQWKQLSRRSGLVFPALRHPKRWKDRFMLISMTTAAIPVIALWWSLHVLGWLPGVLVWLFAGPAFVAWFVLISRINQKLLDQSPGLATEVPFTTAAELSLSVLALNEETFERLGEEMELDHLDEEMIWNRIVETVGKEMKVSPREIAPGMRIGDDVRVR